MVSSPFVLPLYWFLCPKPSLFVFPTLRYWRFLYRGWRPSVASILVFPRYPQIPMCFLFLPLQCPRRSTPCAFLSRHLTAGGFRFFLARAAWGTVGNLFLFALRIPHISAFWAQFFGSITPLLESTVSYPFSSCLLSFLLSWTAAHFREGHSLSPMPPKHPAPKPSFNLRL